jgi:hypothetical protein
MYQLNVNNDAFTDRTKAIFDLLVNNNDTMLNKIEIEFNDEQIENENSIELTDESVNKPITKSNSIPLNISNLTLKEDDDKLFVKPTITISDFKKQPDYVKYPHKWKKYTLEDVSESQMSASANLKAAFSFLNRNEPKFEEQEIIYNKPIGGGRINKQTELKLLENLSEETEEEFIDTNNSNKTNITETDSSPNTLFRKSKKHERNMKLKNLDEINEEEEMEIKINQQDDVIMTSETNNNNIDDLDSSNDNHDNVDGVDCNDYLI